MSIWATLFGMPKVIEGAVDVVKSGVDIVDKAFYTEQEKADNNTKVMDVWLKLQMLLANDNSVSAYTRRMIAFLSYTIFFILVIFACVVYKVDPEWAKFIIETVINLQIAWIVLVITGFFFGGYAWGKYISKDNIPYSTESIDKKNKKSKE